MPHVLTIDQGTTGSTALVMDARGRVTARAYQEFTQYFPQPGWVEHDPEEIWKVSLRVMRLALRRADIKPPDVAAIGITSSTAARCWLSARAISQTVAGT